MDVESLSDCSETSSSRVSSVPTDVGSVQSEVPKEIADNANLLVWKRTPELAPLLWALGTGINDVFLPVEVMKIIWMCLGVTCPHPKLITKVETLCDMWRSFSVCAYCDMYMTSIDEGPFFC
ncbi:hypothetical protein DIPPA_57338 [Diplonema papillatum]|nr:hypothetical protein DIPPA_57338 [Diplonema papillatum]